MSPVVSRAVAFIFQENSHLTATNEKLKLRQHYRAWTKLGTGKSWSLTEPGSKIVACLAQEEAAGKCEPRRYEGWIDPGTAQKWSERVGWCRLHWKQWPMVIRCFLLTIMDAGRLKPARVRHHWTSRWTVKSCAAHSLPDNFHVWIEHEWTHVWIEWMNMIN